MRRLAELRRIRGFMIALGREVHDETLVYLERGHVQDRSDVTAMLNAGLVDPDRLRELFARMEPHLYRYPAVDPPALRRALDESLSSVPPPAGEG